MKLFVCYLRARLKVIAGFFGLDTIFFLFFLLYDLPLKAGLYPLLISFAVGLIILFCDFIATKTRHHRFRGLIENFPVTEIDVHLLPENDLLRADLAELLLLYDRLVRETESLYLGKMRDMSEYYTAWAHQIKTPIASMKLSLHNEDSALARKLNSDLFKIEQYVEMVLVFLRLDSSSTDYVFKRYALDPLIKNSVRKFATDFISKKLVLQYDGTDTSVITDEKWLSFVLEQILSNAIKYTNTGHIRIYMNENELCIEDTGIGIAPEDLPRIFEKGYTGYNGRMDKSASGIGLYLCREICKKLGFSLTAQSDPGKGTTIKIDLSQTESIKE